MIGFRGVLAICSSLFVLLSSLASFCAAPCFVHPAGVLLFRNSKRDDGLMRPHLEDFLSTLFEELEDKVQAAAR